MEKILKNQKISCDKCGEEFVIKELITETVERDIKKTYFVCPKCKEQYITHYSNLKIRKLMEEQGKLRTKGQGGTKTLEKKQKLKTLVEALKKYVEGGMTK